MALAALGRFVFWFLVWCLFLGFATIKVEYGDGYRFHALGWFDKGKD